MPQGCDVIVDVCQEHSALIGGEQACGRTGGVGLGTQSTTVGNASQCVGDGLLPAGKPGLERCACQAVVSAIELVDQEPIGQRMGSMEDACSRTAFAHHVRRSSAVLTVSNEGSTEARTRST